MALKNETEENGTANATEDVKLFEDILFIFLFFSTFVFTFVILIKEIAEMINQKLNWFSVSDICQLLQIIAIFTYQG